MRDDMYLNKNRSNGPKEGGGCCGATACKYTLCIFNFLFLLSGCVVCGLGVWTVLEKGVFLKLMAVPTYEVTSWLLVATGCLAVGTALLGYGAIGLDSRCLLSTYMILLVLVFMFESITGLLAYVYEEQIEKDLNNYLNSTFLQKYSVEKEVTQAVDKIQKNFSCCGVHSYLDWRDSPWTLTRIPTLKVPDSCCKTVSEGCGSSDHPSNIPYTGCIHRFSSELSQHLLLLGAVSMGLALLQIIGVIITSCLFSRLNKRKKYLKVQSNKSHSQPRLQGGYWAAST